MKHTYNTDFTLQDAAGSSAIQSTQIDMNSLFGPGGGTTDVTFFNDMKAIYKYFTVKASKAFIKVIPYHNATTTSLTPTHPPTLVTAAIQTENSLYNSITPLVARIKFPNTRHVWIPGQGVSYTASGPEKQYSLKLYARTRTILPEENREDIRGTGTADPTDRTLLFINAQVGDASGGGTTGTNAGDVWKIFFYVQVTYYVQWTQPLMSAFIKDTHAP